MTTPEGKLRDYMLKKCRAYDIETFKLSFENRRGAPDWLLIGNEKHVFVELKAPKGSLSRAQAILQAKLALKGGCYVRTCFTKDDVDKAICVLI